MSEQKTNTELIPLVDWAEEFFRLSNGEKIKLYPHQKKILSMAFDISNEGILPYKTVILSMPKKSGKTAQSAMITCWFAYVMAELNDDIYVVANDLDQASKLAFEDLKNAIRMEPALAKISDIQSKVVKTNRGVKITALSSDYAGASGGRFSLATFDELWAYQSEGKRRLFDELTPIPTGKEIGRKNSMRLITTYAGFCLTTKYHDVRVLTDKGFTEHYKLKVGDRIATRTEKGNVEYQPVENIFSEQASGPVVNLNHRRCSFSCTPNHKILLDKIKNNKTREMHTVKEDITTTMLRHTGGYLVRTARWKPKKGPRLGFDYDPIQFAALCGWYLSEGNVNFYKSPKTKKQTPTSVTISQSAFANPQKYNEIENLLKLLQLNYSKAKSGYAFYINDKKLAEFFHSFGSGAWRKKLPIAIMQQDKKFLESLFLAYIKCDGHFRDKSIVAYAASRDLVDQLCEIGAMLGYAVRFSYRGRIKQFIKNQGPIVGNTAYEVMFSHKKTHLDNYRNPNLWSVSDYRGEIWCPTVANGNFFVQYDGHCFWSGNSGESDLLEDLYNKGLKGECIDEEHNIWVNKKAGLFMMWDHLGRMPWQTEEYREQQRNQPGMRHSTYRRLHHNEWTAGEEGLDLTEWDQCVDAGRFLDWTQDKANLSNKKIWLAVGVDASTKRDRAAVVSVFKKGNKIFLGPRMYWQPTKQEPLDLEETMEKFIIWLTKNYQVYKVFYDPFQFVRSAQTLWKKGIPMEEFNQNIPNGCKMGNNLLELLRNTNLVLYPDDVLRTEASHVSLKEVPARGWRIDKTSDKKKIDSIVALAMACLAAEVMPTSDESFENTLMILRKT